MMPVKEQISRVGVVVPVHDEQELLPTCLSALHVAAEAVGLPVEILVVLDACTDASEQVVAASVRSSMRLSSMVVDGHNVGLARGAGLDRLAASGSPDTTWLATTDADTLVPADWLTRQVELADAGTDAVLGTVQVHDWRGHPAATRLAFARSYLSADGHPHVHGANLGVRASAYRAAGGIPALGLAEDHALVGGLVERGCRIARVGSIPVVTSARRDVRARGGFGDYLRSLPA